jgi:hypothetical protein
MRYTLPKVRLVIERAANNEESWASQAVSRYWPRLPTFTQTHGSGSRDFPAQLNPAQLILRLGRRSVVRRRTLSHLRPSLSFGLGRIPLTRRRSAGAN